MKVLITGSGQLAWELCRTAPEQAEVINLGRSELDISSAEQIAAAFDVHQPQAIINAAAYTAVDKAEEEPERAFSVNARGPEMLAAAARRSGAYMLQVSTDFVFDGSASTPYETASEKSPLGVYGESKSAGEDAVLKECPENCAIIRTAWVYSSFGNNFVKTMLRLMSDKPQLGVVGDQIGTPTWAKGLAHACWAAVDKKAGGIYHWTDAGVASWYDFAVAIQTTALTMGLLDQKIPIKSIPSSAYPTPAKRPAFSVLDKSKTIEDLALEHRHWQEQLRSMMAELVH